MKPSTKKEILMPTVVRYYVMALVLALLAGCASVAPTLDTENKRIYAAELAVQQMLETVELNESQGRYSTDEWAEVQSKLLTLRTVYVALDGGLPSANLETLYAALFALRAHVEKTQ